MFYVQRGRVPHKRHTQFRRDDGTLYAEELFGVEGFAGRSSLLYHHTPPTQTHQIDDPTPVKLESADPGGSAPHRHHLVNTKALGPTGDALVRPRSPLLQRRRDLRGGPSGGADG